MMCSLDGAATQTLAFEPEPFAPRAAPPRACAAADLAALRRPAPGVRVPGEVCDASTAAVTGCPGAACLGADAFAAGCKAVVRYARDSSGACCARPCNYELDGVACQPAGSRGSLGPTAGSRFSSACAVRVARWQLQVAWLGLVACTRRWVPVLW